LPLVIYDINKNTATKTKTRIVSANGNNSTNIYTAAIKLKRLWPFSSAHKRIKYATINESKKPVMELRTIYLIIYIVYHGNFVLTI